MLINIKKIYLNYYLININGHKSKFYANNYFDKTIIKFNKK